MYSFIIKNLVMKFSLLKHPFYQAWNEGLLSKEDLREYACQYWHHERAFPRCISAIHSKCDDLNKRQVLLSNLIDEEQGEENHSELWLRFAEGLGLHRDKVINSAMKSTTEELVKGFADLARTSYSHGLGAIFAYECQIPDIAKTKIAGLKKFYDIYDERTLQFFSVHLKADEWHSEECSRLIDQSTEKEFKSIKAGAEKGASLLWKFLDGAYEGIALKPTCH